MKKLLLIALLIVGCEEEVTEPKVHPLVGVWELKELHLKKEHPEGYLAEGSEAYTNLDTFFIGKINKIYFDRGDTLYTYIDSSWLYISSTFVYNADQTYAYEWNDIEGLFDKGFGDWSTNGNVITYIFEGEEEDSVTEWEYSINDEILQINSSGTILDDGSVSEQFLFYQRK
jgi:hypothetical protein